MLYPAFKQRLQERNPALGTFVKLAAPSIVEHLGLIGLDFVILDMEHGALTISQVEDLVRAADLVQIPAIVRVPCNEAVLIQQALDVGAAGVQVPGIGTAAELRRAVQAAHYHPNGRRGLSLSHRAARFGTVPRTDYLQQSQAAVVIAHVETVEAVAALPELMAVPGVDVLFVGPADLSQSMGHPGELGHPDVREMILRTLGGICRGPAAAGIFAADAADALRWHTAGASYIAMNSELGLMAKAAITELAAWRKG